VTESGDPPQRGFRRRAPARRRLLLAAGCALVLVAGFATVVAYQARTSLAAVAALVPRLQHQVEAGQAEQARSTLAALQRETRRARGATGGLTWSAGARAPLWGKDLSAVRAAAAILDDLARSGLPPLVDAATALGTAARGAGGALDLSAIAAAAPGLTLAKQSIDAAAARLARIRRNGLDGRVRSGLDRLATGLRRAARLTETARRAVALLPPMLGQAGARTYLVLFQNLAEARATGGMPGEYLVIRVDRGAVSIVDQGAASSGLRTFTAPVLPLGAQERALYTDRLGTYPADVNLTPDFPTVAALAREMYRRRSGRTVDGVLATDPVALSYLLAATGPVAVPGGEPLTATNAVPKVLSEAYQTSDKDEYFAAAARAAFTALLRHQGSPPAVLAELTRAAGERRLLVWSARADEEETLAGTVLSGRLPDDDGAAPTVGVFLNDGTGGKLSYYLTHDAALAVVGCTPDGRREIHLSVRLGSTAPASGLPPYVLGLHPGVDAYTTRTNVSVFSPTGGAVVSALVDGTRLAVGAGTERGRSVAIATVDLRPGTARVLDVFLVSGALPRTARITPRIVTTPGVSPWRTGISSAPICDN
jgi:hypothetical protein